MLDSSDKRGLLLCLLQVLQHHTDERHPLPITGRKSLISLIQKDYQLDKPPGRNTVSRGLELLRDGFDYDVRHLPGKGFYLQQRTLNRLQVKMLEDMVSGSHFLTEENKADLLGSMEKLSGRTSFRGVKQVEGRTEDISLLNREFFRNLDVLDAALEKEVQVQFTYNRVQPDGTLKPVPLGEVLHGGWTAHPFDMVYTSGQYYLIASVGEYTNLRHFRIDHMTELALLPQRRRPLSEIDGYAGREKLDLPRYIREHLLMYGGKAVDVRFTGTEKLSRYLWDVFGRAVKVEKTDESTGQIWFTVHISEAAAYQFARQYCTECTVLAPDSLRQRLAADFQKVAGKYSL